MWTQLKKGALPSKCWQGSVLAPYKLIIYVTTQEIKLEDLKVLKCSPDLLNNVKIGHGQLRLIFQTYFVLPYMGMVAIFGQLSYLYLLNTPYEI